MDYLTLKCPASKITIDLWGEPNSDRYWWGTFAQFERLNIIKLSTLYRYNVRLLMAHTTTSLLVNPQQNKQRYLTWINNTTLYDDNTGFSTSLYKNCSAGEYDYYNNNHFPTRKFNRTVLVECGYSGHKKEGSDIYNYWMSRNMMHYFIDLLKYSVKVGSDTIGLFTLCDGNPNDDKGVLAYWTHDSGNYAPRPAWYVLVDLLSVIKDGWEPTATGVRGVSKEIVLTDKNYTVK
jgi:hypothetical protein